MYGVALEFLAKPVSNASIEACAAYVWWWVDCIFVISPPLKFVALWALLLSSNALALVILLAASRRLQRDIRHAMVAICGSQICLVLRNLCMTTTETHPELHQFEPGAIWTLLQLLVKAVHLGNVLLLTNVVCASLLVRVQTAHLFRELRAHYSQARVYLALLVSLVLAALLVHTASLCWCLDHDQNLKLFLILHRVGLVVPLVSGFVVGNIVLSTALLAVVKCILYHKIAAMATTPDAGAHNSISTTCTATSIKHIHSDMVAYLALVNLLEYVSVVPLFVLVSVLGVSMEHRALLSYWAVACEICLSSTSILAVLSIPSLRVVCVTILKCKYNYYQT